MCCACAWSRSGPCAIAPGSTCCMWSDDGVARPYSLASLPHEDPWLEFHIDCSAPGAFCDRAGAWRLARSCVWAELRGGALRYEPDWQERPLLLMAAGTGLAPLWGYFARPCARNTRRRSSCCTWRATTTWRASWRSWPGVIRKCASTWCRRRSCPLPWPISALFRGAAWRLLCGQPASVERFARHLYLAGVPRSQTLADLFLPHA